MYANLVLAKKQQFFITTKRFAFSIKLANAYNIFFFKDKFYLVAFLFFVLIFKLAFEIILKKKKTIYFKLFLEPSFIY